MGFKDLLIEAEGMGITVKEATLKSCDGRIKGKTIAIRKDIPTLAKKADVLAEELGHYHTTVGRIIEQGSVDSRKQERTARLWSYNKRIGLSGIIRAFENHCRNRYEIADYLGVSEEFLKEALECYTQIYGAGEWVDNYYIRFIPCLGIEKMIVL